MRGVAEGAELVGRLVQRVEIVEELLFRQLFLGEAPFGLVMGVDEVLRGRSPWLTGGRKVVYMHDIGQMCMGSLGYVSPPIGDSSRALGAAHHAARMR